MLPDLYNLGELDQTL